MTSSISRNLFSKALKLIPGGVNSPVRAFRAVSGTPFFTKKAKGSKLHDADGNQYSDYVCTWGPSILGHAHPAITKAISKELRKGTSFGTPHPGEIKMAQTISRLYPSIQKSRMCNSGTEATMSCIRLARGFTRRDMIIKFEGCYHGHVDSLLVKAGSGALTFGRPDSAGIPRSLAKLTLTLPFNDTDAVKTAFKKYRGEIAAIILEPVPANAGLYLPQPGYLEFLRKITKQNGALLIFDEVMTGFRVAPGGVQELCGIRPDLTALGKIIGGGLPVGAFGGRSEIMNHLAPLGPVYQAGTLSGNPLALAAGMANIETMTSPKSNAYKSLAAKGQFLHEEFLSIASHAHIPVQIRSIGSMFCMYFTSQPVNNLDDAKTADTKRFAKFFFKMLQQGIYIAPSQFEAGFISLAHSDQDLEKTVRAAHKIFREI